MIVDQGDKMMSKKERHDDKLFSKYMNITTRTWRIGNPIQISYYEDTMHALMEVQFGLLTLLRDRKVITNKQMDAFIEKYSWFKGG